MRKANKLFGIIFITLFFSSCGNNDDGVATATSDFFFQGDVDGKMILFEEKDDITFVGGRSEMTFDHVDNVCRATYTSGLYKISESEFILTPLAIAFHNVTEINGQCSIENIDKLFLSQLSEGIYNYYIEESGIESTTVRITYIDENNNIWSTRYKPQSENHFLTLVDNESIGYDSLGRKLVKLKGNFNGYVYQYDSETEEVLDSLFMSDAKFVFRFNSGEFYYPEL